LAAKRKVKIEAPKIDFSRYTSIADFAEDCLFLFENNRKQRVKLTPYQRRWLREVEDPRWKVVVICVPKRVGKSLFSAIVAVYWALARMGATVVVLSTSEKHASSVTFKYVRQFCRVSDQVTAEVATLAQNKVEFKNGSVIRAVPCTVEAVAGIATDLLIIDELALIDDEEVVQIAMSQTEKEDAKVLITSTASEHGHLLHRLYLKYLEGEAEKERLRFIYHSAEIYDEHPFITRAWLEERRKQMPEFLFRQYHLNEWGVTGEKVFSPELVEAAVRDYPVPLPIERIEEVLGEKVVGFVFTAAIDRALPFSKHGDRTVGCVVANCLTEVGKEKLVVVDLKVFPTGVAEEIKAWLMQVASKYSLTSVVLEAYQAYDIFSWCKQRGLPAKLEHATREAQLAAFPALIMAFEQGKIIIPRHELLIEELLALERTNGGKFRAGQGKHDDTVFALLWAVYEAVKFSPSKADITII
jgi:acyl-CoA synthetase (AMP-forming)/AMP-acid ligase II